MRRDVYDDGDEAAQCATLVTTPPMMATQNMCATICESETKVNLSKYLIIIIIIIGQTKQIHVGLRKLSYKNLQAVLLF